MFYRNTFNTLSLNEYEIELLDKINKTRGNIYYKISLKDLIKKILKI